MRKYILRTSIFTVLLITLLSSSSSLATEPEGFWIAEFTYDVPGTWAEGRHTYRFEWKWTEPTSGSHVSPCLAEFTISGEAPLYPGFALLHWFHVIARVPGPDGQQCEPMGTFLPLCDPPPLHPDLHPDQPTRFHIAWRNDEPMTYRQAQAHFESITARVLWDDGSSAQLVRHQMFPYRVNEQQWLKMWESRKCSWTVRQ